MYEPDELATLLGEHGWAAQLEATRWFIFGSARPSGSRPKPAFPITRPMEGQT
jgi:hypothetical protein